MNVGVVAVNETAVVFAWHDEVRLLFPDVGIDGYRRLVVAVDLRRAGSLDLDVPVPFGILRALDVMANGHKPIPYLHTMLEAP